MRASDPSAGDPPLPLHSPAGADFCRRWRIKELSVFGSILLDDFRPDCDVDLLAAFEEDAAWDLFDHMDMEDDLTQIVGRKVDRVSRAAIEASENRYDKTEILSTAEPLGASR